MPNLPDGFLPATGCATDVIRHVRHVIMAMALLIFFPQNYGAGMGLLQKAKKNSSDFSFFYVIKIFFSVAKIYFIRICDDSVSISHFHPLLLLKLYLTL